jgi:RNA-binding protein YhbY
MLYKKIEEKKTCISSELISDLNCCTVQVRGNAIFEIG